MNRISSAMLSLLSVVPSLAFAASPQPEPVSVHILSAVVKDQSIPDADVIFQKNGTTSKVVKTNSAGMALATPEYSDKDDVVLMIVRKPGYSNLVARCPCNGMTYALSPVMTNLDGMRVVLTWSHEPADLDLHMVYPNNHVFFDKKNGRDAFLDVDDTDGDGPETITTNLKHEGESYVYAVHNYTERRNGEGSTLSASEAKVFVYVGQSLVKTFEVPMHKSGNLWEVFRVDAQGRFHTINKLLKAKLDSAEHWIPGDDVTSLIGGAGSHEGDAAPVVVSDAQESQAHEINAQGEKAYHANQLEESIALYLRAIELSPDYGQAWSNLGLSYRMTGRTAESLWANRKSIELAHGSDAKVVRASSHFNMGKIYEDAKQWADAKAQYELSQSENPRKVYVDSIARMNAKLGR